MKQIATRSADTDAPEKAEAQKKPQNPLSADAARYFPDPDMGLSSSQVEKRTADGYVNATVDTTSKSTSKIILSNIFTYFNIIYFVLALVLIIAGTSISNLTILAVVIVNTAIGIIQELRAKKTLEKLSLISAPVTKVIRDGHEEFTPEKKLEIVKEIGDVMWYCATLARDLGYELDDVAQMNIDKLRSRMQRNHLTGSGDNR